MDELVIRIMAELFSTIALATRELKEGRPSEPVRFSLVCYIVEHIAVKFVNKILREKNIEAVLQRLDRLTQDEARTTTAQLLEVLYRLVQNLTVVMEGEPMRLHTYHVSNIVRSRWQGIRRWCPGSAWYVSFATR